jgi:MFS transporter, DHA3 family, multidrug efflux protein
VSTDVDAVRNDPRSMRVFYRLLVNSLLSGVVSSFLWFAITFWVYLGTRSVITTAVVGGAYALISAAFGLAFGSFVDRHRKHSVMLLASTFATVAYVLAAVLFMLVPEGELLDLHNPALWLFILLILAGSVIGNMRAIALSTTVSLLVPEHRREHANGMVGTVTGISFAITSVFSGLVIGQLGMGWALWITIAITVAAVVDLLTFTVPEEKPQGHEHTPHVDIRGAWTIVRGVSGLLGLILFASFNNVLGGVFMALMDAYGLEMVDVEVWGFIWGGLSLCFIIGGIAVARFGLGGRPMRLILIGNALNWTACSLFAVRSSIVLLVIGMAVWLLLIPMIEACEQTVLQRAVPFEQQGRVFGFAQMVENSASPMVSIMIGPIAQWWVIPSMTDGAGADAIGSWWGTGADRALALIFTVAGLLGLVATGLAARSRWFRSLDASTSTRARSSPDLEVIDAR